MSELDALKKKRMLELQQQAAYQQDAQAEQEQQIQEQLAQLEAMVRPLLTPEALQRYGNIKIAHPELTVSVLVALGRFAQSGKIKRVDDNMLKTILIELQKTKREIKIKHK
ncbi:hypothetical protein COV93_06735 [Candidatus Woesearchaeota archaeon CG11_big_fil_rev_8_21_14_0_20_43_8]|nr:MAG: hypothetical protein COV93_06735 [Candidatus Woesearchaeota archaeon CG11_big_fil_rev_8_21_14_0_20_43_8]PIO04965.1 MAG: hypothetical protein COT47_06795 [Candidatus Woesearchaeota archaeon CG08_land_8_20_14_0_20_43_7]